MKGFDKGSYIVEQGKTCKHLYFIKSGFLRGFYYQDGKEITSWFASDAYSGDMVPVIPVI